MQPLTLSASIDFVLNQQKQSKKPLAVVLAGHNGSGKSTMWYKHIADKFQIPLVNADRMMMSILPEIQPPMKLPAWASALRDQNEAWMSVAQEGVKSFVALAMAQKVPFATETVFSHWIEHKDGTVESKVDLIELLKKEGYFVLLLFVGLGNVNLSLMRVRSRVISGGHDVDQRRLLDRFPRTQKAIGKAVSVASASILVDNSFSPAEAFRVALVKLPRKVLYDVRTEINAPSDICAWLNVIAPKK